ncbi:MAG: PTS sugar transporter subunit IIC [Oscillospiraceae bacterium]|nr:PTS sugar transporter subunit IIC [Oscillospiraceae bacterium]
MSRMKSYLKEQNIELSAKRYFIDAMGAMAQGLFATLLIGTILDTIGAQFNIGFLKNPLVSKIPKALVTAIQSNPNGDAILEALKAQRFYTIGGLISSLVGPAMAVAIGYALHASPLVLFSLLGVGAAANELGGAGGPLAVYVIAILACECGKLVSKRTKVDILVTPAVTLLVGVVLSKLIAPPIGDAAQKVGELIMWATELQPLFMGILVSVLVGIALTLPISSAAICAALGLTGLAGGAAVAGCCAQMVGFAVMSFRENRWGGLVSQGIGTSMLQMPNILRNPRTWIPPILASAITGPLATCVFHMEMNGAAVNAGMGTCGLCGPIGVWTGWVNPAKQALEHGAKVISPGTMDWIGLALICLVLPAVLSLLFCEIERKLGWIKKGDLKLD